MSGLTKRQQQALEASIAAYLKETGYMKAFEAFSEESTAELSESRPNDLKRTWIASTALQSRMLKLEAQVKEQTGTINALRSGKAPTSTSVSLGPPSDSRSLIQTKGVHRGHVHAMAVHPTYTLAATASADGTLIVHDVGTNEVDSILRGHTTAVYSVAMKGNEVWAGAKDGSIRLWVSGKLFRTFTGHTGPVTALVSLADAVVSGGEDGTVRIWTREGQGALAVDEGRVSAMAVEPRSNQLIVARGQEVAMYKPDLEKIGSCQGASHVISCLTTTAFIPDQKIVSSDSYSIISGDRSGSMTVWSHSGGLPIREYPSIVQGWSVGLGVLGDGRTVVCVGDQTNQLVQVNLGTDVTVATSRLLSSVRGHSSCMVVGQYFDVARVIVGTAMGHVLVAECTVPLG
ncbi:WD domain G-beta repeat [Carpediemonas membranifera]|uniref:WD domain G-beta repeat n=1 Tax=Carpediemonas membranifera TaxID=201153 RepID=A0A8J6E4Q1_9EUKA|nr:WD domain G-beta repeat [Carpediemonas membranifera]|eukprot:KAG9397226.1 WD domain G-beta repeat [Carpediemonas membranifera]